VQASDLQIDRQALEEKERRDRAKLDAMISLCEINQCRQQAILEYFGESDASTCGCCDVCQNAFGGDSRPPSCETETLIVRKALSGVARMSVKTASGYEGVFGKGKIIQMLMGSKSQEMAKWHPRIRTQPNKLTTYGILKDVGTSYLNELFSAMTQAGLVLTQRGEYPLFTLTPRGASVMHGRATFQLVWPGTKSSTRRDAEPSVEMQEYGFDSNLYSRLTDLRYALARVEGVPAYRIFSNQTLEILTRLRPTSVGEGMRIKGIGPNKAGKYLQPFLDEIKQYKAGR
jgi:ATP-dependent DNA helicase RecQ